MAKLETRLVNDFNYVIDNITNDILHGSVSASIEGSSECTYGDVRCKTVVFERYSAFGRNRVSMNVTLVGQGQNLFLSGITSGGSQAVFWKVNTVGEEYFLNCLRKTLKNL